MLRANSVRGFTARGGRRVYACAMTSRPFQLPLRWRRRLVRAYEFTLCGMLLALGVMAAWPY